MRPPKRRILIVAMALVAVLVVAAAGLFLYGRSQLEPVSSIQGSTTLVEVRQGESVDDVINKLSSDGLLKSGFWFGVYARLRGLGDHLRPGAYRLDPGMGASAIIAKLEGTPDAQGRTVTLPEGLTAEQMAQRIADAQLGISAADYVAQVRGGSFDQTFLQGRPAGASLEGFLFPDTYTVPDGTSAHALVQMQLDRFASQAAPLLHRPAAGQTPYQALIVASLVEREARYAPDRAPVAGVIDNRLAQGMLLQVDASDEYGLGITGRSPTAQELAKDTPYNTHLHPGLPPTPISNPGLPSIRAAADPASTSYLFYVSDPCGHIFFSLTEKEHEQQVQQHAGASCS